MDGSSSKSCTAFAGTVRVASGDLAHVVPLTHTVERAFLRVLELLAPGRHAVAGKHHRQGRRGGAELVRHKVLHPLGLRVCAFEPTALQPARKLGCEEGGRDQEPAPHQQNGPPEAVGEHPDAMEYPQSCARSLRKNVFIGDMLPDQRSRIRIWLHEP